MRFVFKPNTNLKTVKLIVEDTGLLTTRFLTDHEPNFLGPSMEHFLDNSLDFIYILELKQNVFVEADKSKNCAVYPTEDHKNYDDCDMDFVRRVLGPDILPLWATTENVSQATSHQTSFPPYVANIASGLTLSPCKLPCTSTTGVVKLINNVAQQNPMITVVFGEAIEITTTKFLSFSLSAFLASLGGSLGLWLGLGLLQLGQEVVRGMGVLLQKVKQEEQQPETFSGEV